MSIKKQIVLIFGIFAVILSVVIGSIYYGISSKNYRENLFAQMEERASVSSQQMSDIVQQMKLSFQVLLSDQDILLAIRALSDYEETDDEDVSLYFSDAYTTIQTGINSYFIYENFYRMIFFNETELWSRERMYRMMP